MLSASSNDGQLEPASGSSLEPAAQCRFCWAPEDGEEGGSLIAPCSCSGTQKWIHQRCLSEWQDTLRAQGQYKRARTCEVRFLTCRQTVYLSGAVCRLQYVAEPEFWNPSHHSRRRRGRLLGLVRHLSSHILDVLHSPSWVTLALRAWRAYVFTSGVVRAVRLGAAGLKAGVTLGRALVTEQTAVMIQLLSTLAEFMGSPYAELLWTQAAAAIVLGLASEFVYTSLIGLATGLMWGFATGYVGAVRESARFVANGAMGGANALFKAACKALRALGLLGRVLPRRRHLL